MKSNFKDLIASKTKQALGSNLISLEAIKQNIVILDELREFIPPLNVEESTQLEQNILKYGCKDALLVWETTSDILDTNSTSSSPVYILIDGHNRFRICSANHISFNIQLLSFPSIKEVKDYMIDLQLGRRNLTPQQASYFRGLRYQNEKVEKGRYLRSEHNAQNEHYGSEILSSHNAQNEHYDTGAVVEHNAQNEHYGKSTAAKLAEEYNVSPVTIRRDADFAAGLGKLDAGLRNDILAGKQNVDKGVLQKLAKLSDLAEPIQNLNELQELMGVSTKKIEALKGTFASVEEGTAKIKEAIQLFEQTKSKATLTSLKKMIQELERFL